MPHDLGSSRYPRVTPPVGLAFTSEEVSDLESSAQRTC